jgi:hypothetical protein
MKTFKLYTFSQVLTVKNCRNQEEALDKAKLDITVVWKIEEIL